MVEQLNSTTSMLPPENVRLKAIVSTPFPLYILAAALVAFSAAAQQDFSKVEIKTFNVSGSVYMLEGSGGNIGVCAGEDGIAIIDDQFAPLIPKIKDALRAISDKPLKFVLNTHFHGEHTGGNAPLGSEATIIAHENVRLRLQQGGTLGTSDIKPATKAALPVITFDGRTSVYLNGEEMRAIHFPHAHTDGDSVIFFTKANVVHMGDNFVTYGFPFVDVKSGGTIRGMIEGVEKVLSMTTADTKFIPGHGPVSTRTDVRKFVDMLKSTRQLVADAIRQGKSVAQMQKEHLLAEFEELGKGFIKTDAWIETLYADVKTASK